MFRLQGALYNKYTLLVTICPPYLTFTFTFTFTTGPGKKFISYFMGTELYRIIEQEVGFVWMDGTCRISFTYIPCGTFLLLQHVNSCQCQPFCIYLLTYLPTCVNHTSTKLASRSFVQAGTRRACKYLSFITFIHSFIHL